MKYFYLIILTLFTITQSDAAELAVAAEGEALTVKAVKSSRSSTPGSESGSVTGSYARSLGGASTIIGRHDLYVFDVKELNQGNVLVEFPKLMKAYTDLLRDTSATDARLSQFVGAVEVVLPSGIDRSSADEDGLTSLQTAFRQLNSMYKTLKKTYNNTTKKVEVFESTIAELKTEQEALVATMAPRPTVHMSTEFSPKRVAATRKVEAESSAVVADLRARNAELAAENARLAAENAKLRAAAAKPSATAAATAKPSKGTDKTGVKEPLLGDGRSTEGYTQIPAATPKPNVGCPLGCNVQ